MYRIELIDKAINEANGLWCSEHPLLFVSGELNVIYPKHTKFIYECEETGSNGYWDLVCTVDEFRQRAKELGWINGYRYGVEYETNGKKPDLPDDVLVDDKNQPASNELLARRVVELTNERDAALTQLVEVQNNRTGKAPCERFCEALATKKMFDNLQRDNQQLREKLKQYDALAAQVEQLRDTSWSAFGDGWYEGFLHYAELCGDSDYVDEAMRISELAESDSVYGKSNEAPKRLAERDAEVAAKSVDVVINHYKTKFPSTEKFTAAWIIEGLEQYANQLRRRLDNAQL